jgi:signal transduction histidine kinase
LFHVAQEALNNVSKHSKAAAVSVSLRSVNGALTLEVIDNGVGFGVPTSAAIRGAHHGMRNMRDRAESVGAILEYESVLGEGTTLRMTLQTHEKGKGND